jgi:hypothetical protein
MIDAKIVPRKDFCSLNIGYSHVSGGYIAMQLRFPHVRLMVYDALLADGATCVQAVVSSAHRMGLIGENKLRDLKAPDSRPERASLFAAEHVLKECLAERGHSVDGKLAEDLWASVTASVDRYMSAFSCDQLAPVVMDFLLQRLTPYL